MVALNQKTKDDLKEIKHIEDEICKLHEKKRTIIKECKHLDTEVEIVETLAFEHTARRVCLVCGNVLYDKTSFKESFEAFSNFFNDGLDDKDPLYSKDQITEIINLGGHNP